MPSIDQIREAAKVRFSDVAFAIGSTPKALRLWLDRGLIPLDSDGADGWRLFTTYDVAVLALARKMADFGIAVDQAGQIASTIVGLVKAGSFVERYFIGKMLIIKRDETLSYSIDNDIGHLTTPALVIPIHDVIVNAIDRARANRYPETAKAHRDAKEKVKEMEDLILKDIAKMKKET
ncbi:MerR family transcriptional regulator [Xanthobacter sp. 126]|uniref:MerR family transcriptional regulator n=1 Tax=Xanthobacter sp. 126 TaxID=1131814 RepID=UPI00045EC2B2|nr:MerR family transcriptional regulator [Xanthobacter sp. 126]